MRAGGAPILIPPVQDEATLRVLYERLDGVLLAGGGDIAPTLYGAEPHAKLGLLDPLRDSAELPMARWAMADGKPILGICRGVQVLNVALGGTLYQDLPTEVPSELQHNQSYEREDWTHLAHEIVVAPNSRLAQALGADRLPTNSLHHQSVRDIAIGLRAVAWAPDGVVEALEGVGEAFVVGVQCHPEALQGETDPRWQGLFAAFVASSMRYRGTPAALAA
jgi:putative glutamine amidotransferase